MVTQFEELDDYSFITILMIEIENQRIILIIKYIYSESLILNSNESHLIKTF